MRLVVGLAALALAAGCGGSSSVQELRAQPPAAVRSPPADRELPGSAQPPVVGASLAPPQRSRDASPDAVYSPAAITVVAHPSAAYAGTASSGPGRMTSPVPSPTPRPTPTAVAGTVTVTQDDSGATVHLARGQHLRVQLGNGTWDPPVSSANGVVLRRSSSGGYPTDQPVDATFDAVSNGSAEVTAQSDAACFHTEPRCMMASRAWQVHVVVS